MLPGAIFDMDGLMFDTESIWQEGWKVLAKKYGYEPDEGFSRDISGTSGEIMIGVINRYYPKVDAEAFILEEREFVEERLKQEVPIKPGLFKLLDYLKEHEVRMAVASSSQVAMIRSNLRRAKVADYFNIVLSSSQVEKAKPEPDVFLRAAELLNLPPEQCYVLEDSFGGVKAGAAAGCSTIMIPDQRQPDDEMKSLAAGIYDTLGDFCDAIEAGEI